MFAATVAASQVPGPAPETADVRYRRCAQQARSEPALAVEAANAWLTSGGGLYARQCLGLAYVSLERWSEAAAVYERAAGEVAAAQGGLRADLLVQAGNAWIAGAEPTRGIQAFDQALAVPALTDQLRGEVHLDRGRALVGLGNVAGARQDIDRGLALVPTDPFAWYLSAALSRREGNLTRARSDINRALELSPDSPDVQLLAGTLAGLAGDLQEAERLYRRVVERAPQSEAGRAASASLATIREVEQPAPASAAAPAAPQTQSTTQPPGQPSSEPQSR